VGPVETPKLAWDVDLGSVVFSTPTIADGPDGEPTAYVGTHGGRFVGVALAGARAGKLVLDLTLGGRVWATAAVDDGGVLYVGDDDDTLYAIDPKKGEIIWKKQLGDCEPTRAPGPEGARCDVDGGPTLAADGDLYVGADGMYRITREGDVVWHYTADEERPKHVFSSPAVGTDGSVYFGGQDGFVTALASDGSERWRYKVTADVDGSPALGPDGEVYVGADDGRVYALRRDGSLRWSFVAQKDIRSAVTTTPQGRIYVSSFDGNLYALEASGEVVWVFSAGGVIHSSPVVDAAGTVYVGSQDDHLYALTPKGKVRWKLVLPQDVDSSVAIAEDGTIVFGCDDGHLRAYR
jgi:outer membrane protein assembly factor BamB